MATYLKFLQLESSPFEGPSSERLVLATESLRRAYTDIKAGLEDDSPRICLSGGAGIGKSSLARALPKLLKQEARSVLIKDPEGSWSRLRDSIVRQLELAGGLLSRETLVQARADGSRLVLLIDQAEKLDTDSLDHLDTLLGYRGDRDEPLVQCVLLANLDSASKGDDVPLMWWLDKLTTLQLRFSPIPEAGIRTYVDKHLKKAGWGGGTLFTDDAVTAIHRYTGGIPGAVSALCEQLLTRAATQRMTMIEADLVSSLFERGDKTPERERRNDLPSSATTSAPAATEQHEPEMKLEQGLYVDGAEDLPSQGEATFSDARREIWTEPSPNRHRSVKPSPTGSGGIGKHLVAVIAAGMVLAFVYGPLDAKPLLKALPIDLDFLGLSEDDARPKARRVSRRQPPTAKQATTTQETRPTPKLTSPPASALPTEPQLAANLGDNTANSEHDVPPTMSLDELQELAEETDGEAPEFQPWTMEGSAGSGPAPLADTTKPTMPLAPRESKPKSTTRVLVAAPPPPALPPTPAASSGASTGASKRTATAATTSAGTSDAPAVMSSTTASAATSSTASATPAETSVAAEPTAPASR